MKAGEGMKLSDRAVLLYCFAPAGGSAEMFWRWQAAMPPGVEVRAVERPGRGERCAERAVTGHALLADMLAAEVAGDVAREPAARTDYAFFGQGGGAALAFSVCARVEQHLGRPPVHGILAGGLPPHLITPSAADLGDEALVAMLPAALAGEAGGLPELADLRSYFLPLLRADLRALQGASIDGGVCIDAPLTVVLPPDDAAFAARLREWAHCSLRDVRFVVEPFAGDGEREVPLALPLLVADVLSGVLRFSPARGTLEPLSL